MNVTLTSGSLAAGAVASLGSGNVTAPCKAPALVLKGSVFCLTLNPES